MNAPKLKASYTLGELSTMLDKDTRTVARWLADNDVQVDRVGRERVVWLADLVAAFPQMEKSLHALRGISNASDDN